MEKFLWVIFMLTMLFICTSCSNDDLSRTENYNKKQHKKLMMKNQLKMVAFFTTNLFNHLFFLVIQKEEQIMKFNIQTIMVVRM